MTSSPPKSSGNSWRRARTTSSGSSCRKTPPSLPAPGRSKPTLQFEEWKKAGIFRNSPAGSVYFLSPDLYPARFLAFQPHRLHLPLQARGPGHGGIYPHERTFPLVTREQLALLRSCSASFSQIFALFEDDPAYHAFLEERASPPAGPSSPSRTSAVSVTS